MSEWKKMKLGEICQIIDGDRGKNYPKNHEFFESGYCLFLNTGNVTKEGFSFANNQFITKEKDELLRKGKIQRGDLILTTRGTVGNIAYYTNLIKYENVRINSGMVILRVNKEKVDASFLYQLVRSKESRTYINSFCTGSAQPQLPIKNLSQIGFEIPPLPIQHRIASILSRYDSLIENYQKQIKLLEEAAQRLYKEWFVDLHFPGHENTKIVDGVPEGWEKKRITDLLEIKYGKDHKKLLDGNIPVYGTGGIMRYANSSLYTGESVLIPRKGSLNNIMLVDGTFWTIDTMFYSIPKIENSAKIAYFYLCEHDMYSMNIGAAVPSMTINILNGMELLLPTDNLRREFEKFVGDYYRLISSLQSQIRLLTEARDRLLPKLMSGEIAV